MLFAAALAALDQATKAIVAAALPLHARVEVTPWFNLVHVLNPGAAFSFLADASGWQRYFLSAIGLTVSAILLWMLWRGVKNRLEAVAYAGLIGGALGNVIDRLRLGAVVDYLDFYWQDWHWPAFNLADILVVGGAGLLITIHGSFAGKRYRHGSHRTSLRRLHRSGGLPAAEVQWRRHHREFDRPRLLAGRSHRDDAQAGGLPRQGRGAVLRLHDVQVIFVTLDPERDSAALLAQYVPAFDPTFLGLRGSVEGTAAVAKDFKIFYQKVPGADAMKYTLDHTAASYVFDPEGRLRLFVRYGMGTDLIAADIKRLL